LPKKILEEFPLLIWVSLWESHAPTFKVKRIQLEHLTSVKVGHKTEKKFEKKRSNLKFKYLDSLILQRLSLVSA